MFTFLDIETTGLDPSTEEMLELGIVITDDALVVVAEFNRVIHSPIQCREHAVPTVQAMHDANGLWAEAAASEKNLRIVELEAVGFMAEHSAGSGKPPMCGNTIGFDRSFIKVKMPHLHNMFSHRNIDVSVLRELSERWYPAVYAGRPQTPAHRSIPDCRGSIAQLQYYRLGMMK